MMSSPGEARSVTILLNPEGTHELPNDLNQLQAITLSVDDDEPLGQVSERAQQAAGITVADARFLFVSAVLDDGTRTLAPVPAALVDADGVLRWKKYPYDFSTNTFADLRRSRDAEIFEGDPDVIVIDHGTTGNGGFLLSWQEIVKLLQSLGGVGDGLGYLVAIPLGIRKGVRAIARRRAERSDTYVPADSREAMVWLSEFFDRRYPSWIDQGAASATDFLYVIATNKSWDAASLAQLIQISPAEARTLLALLGYELQRQSGKYRLSNDEHRKDLRRQVLRPALGFDPATYEPLS